MLRCGSSTGIPPKACPLFQTRDMTSKIGRLITQAVLPSLSRAR